MPYSESFVMTKLIVDFTLPDGTSKTLETKIQERKRAEVKYEEAVASGKTAVMANLPAKNEAPKKTMKTMKIMLGNFPPGSLAHLRAYCS
jgi:hypothetical protein